MQQEVELSPGITLILKDSCDVRVRVPRVDGERQSRQAGGTDVVAFPAAEDQELTL